MNKTCNIMLYSNLCIWFFLLHIYFQMVIQCIKNKRVTSFSQYLSLKMLLFRDVCYKPKNLNLSWFSKVRQVWQMHAHKHMLTHTLNRVCLILLSLLVILLLSPFSSVLFLIFIFLCFSFLYFLLILRILAFPFYL